MRFLVKATIPVEAGNALIRDPNWGQRIQGIIGDMQPETVYFAPSNGQRAVYMIVNLEGAHEIPRIAEPLWLAFNAAIEFVPVMTQEDFGQAAQFIDQAGKKYQ